MAPVISVIVTTYNHENYIEKALESILMQKDCPEFEIVIGNDCSTDNTGKIIENYASKYPQIKVLTRDKNLGMLYNFKNCFENCSGNYIAILEGDDYWHDDQKLKKQYELLKNSEALFCFNDIYLLEKEGEPYKKHVENAKKTLNGKITAKQHIELGNPIANFSCCMYKKEALKYIPETYWEDKDNADWLFNLYILDQKDGIYLNERCSVYRINEMGLWSRLANEEREFALIKAINNYNKYFNYKYKESFYKRLSQIVSISEKNLFSKTFSVNKNKKIKISVTRIKK